MKDGPPFNRPFSKLEGIVVKRGTRETPRQEARVEPLPATREEMDDATLFRRAMEGVRPMSHRDTVEPEPLTTSEVVKRVRENKLRQDMEVIQALSALVRGTSRFDVTCTGEYLEGHVTTLDPRVMKRLKTGDYAVQAHLDLHGALREEAKVMLRAFVENSHAMGLRCLLVIHGRGLKSESGPVLKEAVVKWLTTGELSRLVLAFCSARPCDGGTGAIYVLLRRRPERARWKRP